MKACVGVDVQIHVFLTTVLVCEYSASGLDLFTPGERIPFAYLINYYAMKAYWEVDV
jgi:hypothetical protein